MSGRELPEEVIYARTGVKQTESTGQDNWRWTGQVNWRWI